MRYVAKKVCDVQPEEPVAFFSGVNNEYMEKLAAAMNRDATQWEWLTWTTSKPAYEVWGGIVDTHDSWHTARVEAPPLELTAEDVDAWKDRKAARRQFKAERKPAQAFPTDAEIVAAYEKHQRDERTCKPQYASLWVGKVTSEHGAVGHHVPMAEVHAAWSRELKRKQAEARDKERHRVICEDQYEL